MVLLFLQAISSFMLLPFFLNYLSSADFGKYTLTISIAALIQLLSGLSIADGVTTFFYSFNKSEKEKLNFISTVIAFTLISAFLLLIIFSLLGNLLFYSIFGEKYTFWNNGIFGVIFGLLSSIIIPYQYYLRNNFQQNKLLFISISSLALGLVLQIFVLLKTNLGLVGCYYAKVISLLLPAIYIVIDSKYFSIPRPNCVILKPMLRYSLQTLPIGILKWFTNYADRFYLEKYFTTSTVAVYGTLCSVAYVGQFFFLSLGQALQPAIYDDYSSQSEKEIDYNNTKYSYLFAFSIIVLILLLISSLLLEHITSNKTYHVIKYYTPFLLLCILIDLFTYKYILILTFSKDPTPLLISSLLGTIISIVCYITIIPYFGIYGAILIILLNNLLRFLICAKEINKISGFYLLKEDLKST
jgi:O-antigen/teichoic acid export membrane protein